jgi:hypothetical protein
MDFNLPLTVLAVCVRGSALPVDDPGVVGELDGQELRDLHAFRRTGWTFHRDADVNWQDFASHDQNQSGGIEAGLVARRDYKRGLVIIRNRVVVALANAADAERIRPKYPDIRELPFGVNLYEVNLGLPTHDLHSFIQREIGVLEESAAGAAAFVEPVLLYHVEDPVTKRGRKVSTPLRKFWAWLTKSDLSQWNWDQIKLPEAWKAASTRGQNTLVAVIDTGFFEHPQFQPNVDIRAYLDEQGNDIIRQMPMPERPHGTMCAGLVGATADDGWVNGAAPECRLMLVALGDTVDSTGMSAALKMCASRGAHVITCSLGPSNGWDCLKALLAAIDDVNKNGRNGRGTLVVWAVFDVNQRIAPNTLESYDPLICVAPSDIGDVRAKDSGYGDGLDLIAPGVDVPVLTWDGNDTDVSEQTGASLAAPCVAGVAALVLSFRPKLALTDLVKVITEMSCDPDIQNKQWNQYVGWGRLNAERAVGAASKFPA